MSFITKGKTNWKFLLIVFILAAIVGGGILIYQYEWAPKEEIMTPEVKVPEKSAEEQLRECGEIERKDEKAECYKNVAINEKDPTVCERIPKEIDPYMEYQEQDCYVEVAVSKRDETICAKAREIYRDACYEKIAEIKKNPDICEEIIDRDYVGHKDNCYIAVAITKQDSTICEKAQNQIYKSWCVKTVQREPFVPEEVVIRFLHEYLYQGVHVEKSSLVTEEYKKKIAETIQVMVDPVIFAQAEPDEGIVIGEATIINDTSSLIATLKYSGGGDHNLEVWLLLINNQWKINDITWPK